MKKPPAQFDPVRRRLLAGFAAGTASAALSGCGSSSPMEPATVQRATASLPDPSASGIDHVVVVMMENRSFDHYFGWLPGADGRQTGLHFVDSAGHTATTHPLAPDYQNCASADPDHSYQGGRIQFNNGAMDGFLLTQPLGDTFPIGYYTAGDLPFFAACAAHWTVCDRYFSGILSSTYPNRFYMHAGQTDRNENTMTVSSLTTVWDELAAAGLSGRYYYSDLPFTALWGPKYLSISQPFAAFLLDAASDNLPQVAFVDPAFVGEAQGVSRDDHPLADIRDGQAFLNQIYDALRTSPAWPRTLLVINYDEWGGFFDHVAPPLAPVAEAEFQATGNDGRLGFRVPCVLIGPRARRGHIEHGQHDPNSILNFIAWRWGLPTLGARGATSANLALALDFSSTDTSAPAFSVPGGPFGRACSPSPAAPAIAAPTAAGAVARQRAAEHVQEWQQLKALALRYGFPVG